MKVEINPRGNGACPLCMANDGCQQQRRLVGSLAEVDGDLEMEIVVYTCPYFKEKA